MESKNFLILTVYILILFVSIENIFTLSISYINFENKTGKNYFSLKLLNLNLVSEK